MTLAQVLVHIRETSNGLADEIATLSADAWNGPSNCPPWTVSELCTHMVTSGQGFVGSIRNGLAGSVEPGRRAPGDLGSPVAVATALSDVTREFLSLYIGLTESQLEMVCFHRRGNRSVRWYASHRLAELVFHGWDLHTSLHWEAVLNEDVAELLLPTLLESNVPRTYAAGLSQERGAGERYLLRSPHAAWTVVIGPDDLQVTRGETTFGVSISGPAATLALLAYGRTPISNRALRVEGDPAQIERFARIFPVP
jgi:uncharacterized protein (TIGR03083 family)